MREIKFRAWDGDQMRGGDKYSFSMVGDINDAGELFADVYKHPENNNKIVFMQYTGLKDKNGTEIYEGDILGKRPYGYLKSDGTKDGRYKGKEWECIEVKWGEWSDDDLCLASGYEYETDGKVAGWNITFGHQSEYDDELKNYEVIGNIYENPELLQS